MGKKRYTKIDEYYFQEIHPALTPLESHVLMALLYHRNAQTNTCWPSLEILARDTGLSPRTVQRGLRGLIAKRVIAVSRRHGRRGNLYSFLRVDAPSVN